MKSLCAFIWAMIGVMVLGSLFIAGCGQPGGTWVVTVNGVEYRITMGKERR